MAHLTIRTDVDKQAAVPAPNDFNSCVAWCLRCDGIVYMFTRPDGRKVALSFEGKPGVYVVWCIDSADCTGYTTFLSRVQAIKHAIHCATVVYNLG